VSDEIKGPFYLAEREVDCLSEPETRIAVHNYRAAFPKPTAEEKENG